MPSLKNQANLLNATIQTDQALTKNFFNNQIQIGLNPAYLNTVALNQQIIDLQNEKVMKNGLIGGGTMTILSQNTLEIASGTGIVVLNYTDQVPILVQWSTSQFQIDTSSCQICFVLVDSNGNFFQTSYISLELIVSNILLGRVWIDHAQTIVSTQYTPNLINIVQPENLGPLIQTDSVVFGAIDHTRNIYKSGAASLYGLGINASNNLNEPNTLQLTWQQPCPFILATSQSIINSMQTEIPTAEYFDQNGVLVQNPFGIRGSITFYFFAFTDGRLFVQYGQSAYRSLEQAKSNIDPMNFARHPWIQNQYTNVFVGCISLSNEMQTFNDYAAHFVLNATRSFGFPLPRYNIFVNLGEYQQIFGQKEFVGYDSWNELISMRCNNPDLYSTCSFSHKNQNYTLTNYYASLVNNQNVDRQTASVGINGLRDGRLQSFLQFDQYATNLSSEVQLNMSCSAKIDTTNQQPQQPIVFQNNFSNFWLTPADRFQDNYDVANANDQFPIADYYGQTIQQNDTWLATSSGTIQGVPINVNEFLRALVDNPTSPSDWTVDPNKIDIQSMSFFGQMSLTNASFERTIQTGLEILPGFSAPTIVNHAVVTPMMFSSNITIPSIVGTMDVKLIQQATANCLVNKMYSFLAIGNLIPNVDVLVQEEIAYAIGEQFGQGGQGTTQQNFGLKDETNANVSLQNYLQRLSLGDTFVASANNRALVIGNNSTIQTPSISFVPLTTLARNSLTNLSNGTTIWNSDLDRIQVYTNGVWKSLIFE